MGDGARIEEELAAQKDEIPAMHQNRLIRFERRLAHKLVNGRRLFTGEASFTPTR
jgi:hypothetical protein